MADIEKTPKAGVLILMPLNNQTQTIPLPRQPLRLPPNPGKNSITHRAGEIVRQHRFHIGDCLLRLRFQLSHYLQRFLFGIAHRSGGRDKVPWQSGSNDNDGPSQAQPWPFWLSVAQFHGHA